MTLIKDASLDEGEFVEKLQFYYGQLFPTKGFYDWLSYGNGEFIVDPL